jgi:hypothetical protein
MKPDEAMAQEPTPTATPAPIWTPGPTPSATWYDCGAVPEWWGLRTPSPRWFTLCGHCRGVWPTQTPRFFPSPTSHPYFATTTPITVSFPAVTPTPSGTPFPTPTPDHSSVWRIDIVLDQFSVDGLSDYGATIGSYYFSSIDDVHVSGAYWISAQSGAEGGFRVVAQLYWLGPGVTPTLQINVTVGTGPYDFEDFRCLSGLLTGAGSATYLSPGHISGDIGPLTFWDFPLALCPYTQFRLYSYYYQSSKAFFSDNSQVVAAIEYYAAHMRHSGFFEIRISSDSVHRPHVTPTPGRHGFTDPTPTPAPSTGPCSQLNPGDDIEVISVPKVGPGVCAGVGPVDFALPLVGGISIPRISICFIPIWFGSINIFGLRTNLDFLFSAAASAMILRWLWRS